MKTKASTEYYVVLSETNRLSTQCNFLLTVSKLSKLIGRRLDPVNIKGYRFDSVVINDHDVVKFVSARAAQEQIDAIKNDPTLRSAKDIRGFIEHAHPYKVSIALEKEISK